jgi:hypothetical protein
MTSWIISTHLFECFFDINFLPSPPLRALLSVSNKLPMLGEGCVEQLLHPLSMKAWHNSVSLLTMFLMTTAAAPAPSCASFHVTLHGFGDGGDPINCLLFSTCLMCVLMATTIKRNFSTSF